MILAVLKLLDQPVGAVPGTPTAAPENAVFVSRLYRAESVGRLVVVAWYAQFADISRTDGAAHDETLTAAVFVEAPSQT